MQLRELLSSLGLSRTEAGIYMDLLEYGTQTISSIARTSELHRPAIYRAIPSLKEKGLISERTVGKLTHYSAEPPENLRGLLDTMHYELDTLIPNLTEMYETNKPHVRRLDGKVGIHAVFNDIIRTLKKGEEFYRITSVTHRGLREVGVPKGYEKARDEKKIERLVIANDGFIKTREPKLEESLRLVPDEFLPFTHNICQIIYGNKVAFLDYDKRVATVIENETIAAFQKDVFKMLFKQLKRNQ